MCCRVVYAKVGSDLRLVEETGFSWRKYANPASDGSRYFHISRFFIYVALIPIVSGFARCGWTYARLRITFVYLYTANSRLDEFLSEFHYLSSNDSGSKTGRFNLTG